MAARSESKEGRKLYSYYNSTEVLFYEDNYCKLTDRTLSIKNYYYPFGSAVKIPIPDIRAVYYEAQESSFGSSWGLSCSDWCRYESWPFCNCTWWALSCCRECGGRDSKQLTNVVVDTGSATMKGFSVENVQEFTSLLRRTVARDVQIVGQILF